MPVRGPRATPQAEPVRDRLTADEDWAAPHVVDVEVYGVIRDQHRAGHLDGTAAAQAVSDLADWPGQRFAHRAFLDRAWELRDNVRGWDAMYVALAEALDAVLLTTDRRLARVPGPRCHIELSNRQLSRSRRHTSPRSLMPDPADDASLVRGAAGSSFATVAIVSTIPQKELRNNVGDVLRRAERGERLTVTVSGRPVAVLGPIRARTWVSGAELRDLWRLPVDPTLGIDLERFDAGLDDPWRG